MTTDFVYSDDELALIALDSLTGMEYKCKAEILGIFSSPRDIFDMKDADYGELAAKVGESRASAVRLAVEDKFVKNIVDGMNKRGIKAICSCSPDYPTSLAAHEFNPLIIYAKGNYELLKSKKIFGVVGSRKTLNYATKFAESFSESVSRRGGVIVTGTADGADSAAIRGALESGRIISVLAHGHDFCYPESNRSLLGKVAERGLTISEYPFDCPVRAWNFPVRNRIIAALGKGVLIVSGSMTSGARHTAAYAMNYGAEVFALPYSIGVSSGELNNHLIKNGASLCDSPDDVNFLLNLGEDAREESDLEETEAKVFNAVRGGADDAYKLMNELGMKIYEIQPVISALEMKGLVSRLAGNKFKAMK